jgi:nitrogen regulatory protein PII
MGDSLKEVTAFIRPEKWSVTYAALLAAGVEDVTQHRVLGRGKQRGLRYLRRGAGEGDMAYLPKRMVVCVVADPMVPSVIEAIFMANRTGNVGDGKIFIRSLVPYELPSKTEVETREAVTV